MSSSKSTDDKVFDVSKPGQATPTASARPIIVTNRPVLKDPMMTLDEKSTPTPPVETTEGVNKLHGELKLQPVVSDETPKDVEEKVATDQKPPKEADSQNITVSVKKDNSESSDHPGAVDDQVADASEAEKPKDDQPKSDPKSIPAESVPPKADETDDQKEQNVKDDPQKSPEELSEAKAAENKAAAEHREAVQKLVNSQQYFLPINSVEKRRTKQHIVIGLILAVVLGAAWVDMALDAQLIHLGNLQSLTHFFH
ncbi:MAG TPA: hypothetical protein VNE40_03610 [Candidatus Dormibacteraeota bacterium]|nr:hypothetical protein [Candidatus Dormibacteraeota bacterium]